MQSTAKTLQAYTGDFAEGRHRAPQAPVTRSGEGCPTNPRGCFTPLGFPNVYPRGCFTRPRGCYPFRVPARLSSQLSSGYTGRGCRGALARRGRPGVPPCAHSLLPCFTNPRGCFTNPRGCFTFLGFPRGLANGCLTNPRGCYPFRRLPSTRRNLLRLATSWNSRQQQKSLQSIPQIFASGFVVLCW